MTEEVNCFVDKKVKSIIYPFLFFSFLQFWFKVKART